jgi:hypothetical protein
MGFDQNIGQLNQWINLLFNFHKSLESVSSNQNWNMQDRLYTRLREVSVN